MSHTPTIVDHARVTVEDDGVGVTSGVGIAVLTRRLI